MGNSSSSPKVRKPRPDFPLYPHATNRWAKKVRGKLHYFGKCADDPDGVRALEQWLDQKDELLAGRTPRVGGEWLKVRDACNAFHKAKENARDAGEITARTFADYKATTDRIIEAFGKTRLVADLAADDFESLRAALAKTLGPVALGNEIQRVRTVFKYAKDAGLIEGDVRFGPNFKRPAKKVMRLARAEAGPKMFEAADVQKLLENANRQMRAMILLAVNCGFGNHDCASLPIKAVDLDRGWIDFPRPKTGLQRRCPLWRETVQALRDVLTKRRQPNDPAHAELLFITKKGGTYGRELGGGAIAKEFAKVAEAAGLTQSLRGFYALRHTFRTIADGCRDFPAIDLIMGHADHSIADRYRERIDDERLNAVAEHVHAWLYAEAPPQGAERPADTNGPTLRVFAG